MMAVAALGFGVNLLSAWILFPARDLNLNVKGALFHVMADILGSLGTVVTAGIIMITHLSWPDTVISVIIAGMVLFNAVRVVKEALTILMESAPERLDVESIRKHLEAKPSITDVHDLHVWTITTGKEALLAHVRVSQEAFSYDTAQELEKDLRDTYDLCHITVQLEPPGFEEEDILF